MGDVHKEKPEDGGQNVYLPPEIIHEIVSRLPVKPLCRFKLVSKSWESLISDPDFVANYSKAAFENKDVYFSRRRLLFTTFIPHPIRDQRIYSLDVDQFLSENPNAGVDGLAAAPTELGFVYNYPPRLGLDSVDWDPNVHYSCYGLILSQFGSDDYRYSLINPVTKESKKLPEVPLPIWRLQRLPSYRLYELGFDHSTNEYKVICGHEYSDGVVYSVYTLQTDSWRLIDCLFPYRAVYDYGIKVNGGIHWLVWKVEYESLVIVSFILAGEKVREITLPPDTDTTIDSIHLGAFRDWLCITSTQTESSETFNEFWVMKKYGVSESWTKIRVSIPYNELSHSGFWTQSHDLMLFDGSSLVMYNFNDDTYWTLSIDKVGDIGCIGIYVETLPTLTHRSRTLP